MRGIGLVLLFVLAAALPSLAKTELNLPAKVPPSWGEHKALLDTVLAAPASDDEKIIEWVRYHSDEVVPVFLLEMARRLLPRNPNLALEWLAIADVRAFYDGRRCADTSVAQGALILRMRYEDLWKAGMQDYDRFSAAGLRAVARGDLLTRRVSPMWACFHGARAYAGEHPKLLPQDQWYEIAKQERARALKFYTEMGQPQNETAKRPDRMPDVYALPSGVFAWRDAETLVYAAKGTDGSPALNEWRLPGKTNFITVFSGDYWCAAGGNLAYRAEVPSKNPKEYLSPWKLDVVSQKDRQTFMIDPRLTGLRVNLIEHKAITLNAFDCLPVENKWLSERYADGRWFPLRASDGFMALKGPTQAMNPALTVEFYRGNEGPAVELPIALQGLDKRQIRYFNFRAAYFISLPMRSGDRCQTAWWFDAKSGKTEQICLPSQELANQTTKFGPSRKGLLRFVKARLTARGEMPGGVYLTRENGVTEKLWEGEADDGIVSPGGCLAAIASSTPVVIDVCSLD